MFAKELSLFSEFQLFFEPLWHLTEKDPGDTEDRRVILHLLEVIFQKGIREWCQTLADASKTVQDYIYRTEIKKIYRCQENIYHEAFYIISLFKEETISENGP